MSQIFEELERRGLIAQMTHPEKIREKLDNEKVVFYIGFDATADSLHVGHFLQLMVINHMIRAGHTPILLLGTGTTMVGDPTGRTDMRKMLPRRRSTPTPIASSGRWAAWWTWRSASWPGTATG